jgi:hypothetical protein
MTPLPENPWMPPPPREFVLDESAFLEAIEPAPLFLSDPSPEYLTAAELMPLVEVLTAY